MIKRLIVILFRWAPYLTSYNSFDQKEWLPKKEMQRAINFEMLGPKYDADSDHYKQCELDVP